MAQPFLIALGGGDRLARRFQGTGGTAPAAPGGSHRIAQLGRDAEHIQQSGMADRIGQAHLFVLALHLYQQRPGTA